jgi:LysR family nitrogen assimilation transcriptional regulator
MQLRHLRYFVKIVEAGSFSRAASTIHVAQPALSQQISELEDELGVSLLHRSARGVRPTDAGQTLYREATAILQQIEQLPGKVRSSGGLITGVVNLGINSTLSSFLAGGLIEVCRDTLPQINLRLSTAQSLQHAQRIEARTLDLALVYEDRPMPGVTRQELFRHRLFLICYAPPEHATGTMSLETVASLPLVLPARPNVARDAIDRAFADAGLAPNIVAEADNLFSLLAAVHRRVGNTVLPKGDLSDVPGHETAVAIPIEPPVYLSATLLSAADIPLSAAGQAVRDTLIRFLSHALREHPPSGTEWIGAEP